MLIDGNVPFHLGQAWPREPFRDERCGRLKRFDAIVVKEPLAGGFDGILRNLFWGFDRGRWSSIELLLAGFDRAFPGFDGAFLSRGSVTQF